MQKKIAAVHDLSGYGRCSLTTAIPVLSACGFQCCPVPTAVLSAHTAYPDIFIRDLTGDLPAYIDSLHRLGVTFDAVYSGYLSSVMQVESVLRLIKECSGKECLILVDPVMGDNGAPYAGISCDMVNGMRRLCAAARVIAPNLTEAALLLGESPSEYQRLDPEKTVRRLARLGPEQVILTGVRENGKIGAVFFSARTEESGRCLYPVVPGDYPGTGDLFASLLLGRLMLGDPLEESVSHAASFVRECAQLTFDAGSDPRDGVQFERMLYLLPAERKE